jgi:hypothetical protein
MVTNMIFPLSDGIAGASLVAVMLGLAVNWRHRVLQRRENAQIRAELAKGHEECLGKISRMRGRVEESERNAQLNAELLHDGRLSASSRSRALRMLRSGMSAETAATELGMAKSEVRLLEKVAAVLTLRN